MATLALNLHHSPEMCERVILAKDFVRKYTKLAVDGVVKCSEHCIKEWLTMRSQYKVSATEELA
ncbi:hypothetical protein TSMEX_008486 [Taenia solium]|eukprot:TsM_000515200 transcript=TsM_000515200 gene=TsM_000515200